MKATSKMLARARYENEIAMADAASSEEEELQVWDSVPQNDEDDVMEVEPPKEPITKEKQKVRKEDVPLAAREDAPGWTKRRRPAVDPFAGEPFLSSEIYE
jgi:hypothetical protein